MKGSTWYTYCTTCKIIKRAIQIKSLWIFCSSSHDALKWFLSKPKLKPRIKHLPHQCLWKAKQCFKSIFWLFVLKHSLLRCQTNTWKYNHSQSILLLKYTIIHMFAHVATQAFSKCVTGSPHFISPLLIYLTSLPICPTATSVTSTSVTWALMLAFEVFFCYHLSSEVRLVS